MDTFAFIIHPIDPKRDIARKYPLLAKMVNDWMIYQLAPLFPAVYLSEIEGITSVLTGKKIKGWLIACPLTPRHFLELPEKQVYRKIIETGRMAQELGAKILGLGAFTSVVGDAGQTIARSLDIPVTTGDSYTVAVAVRSVKQVAQMLEIPWEDASVAVVGATGAIGRACAVLLSRQVAELYLISRYLAELEKMQEEMTEGSRARLHFSTEMQDLRNAQVILTMTSSLHAVVEPEYLQPGSVICDIARPRDVSMKIASARPDVLVIDGGMVEVPGAVDFHFDFGFPPGKAYACMAETMALTLEGRFENYTLGKRITLEKVEEISTIADKHGFQLSGFRSFERPVTEAQIEFVRQNVRQVKGHS